MLKRHKKLKIPLLLIMISLGGIFLYQYLTFTPSYSSAAPISTDTPVVITPTTPLAKWDDLEYMQQMTPQACADANIGDSKTLIDDSAGYNSKKTYTVQKMEINNECWMTENMDNENGRKTRRDIYGGYYDWDQANNNCTYIGDGWTLPTQAQYQSILASYNNMNGLIKSPYKFLAGGSDNSTPIEIGNSGYYWSSTPSGTTGAAYLYFTNSGSYMRNYFTTSGYSVRCVSKDASDIVPVDPSNPDDGGINDPTLSVTVPDIITLDVSNSVDITTEANKVNTGEFITAVESNKNYTISLNATSSDSDATSLVNYKDNNKVAEIPTITGNTQPQPGVSSWGIMLCNGTNKDTCTNSYRPLPAKNVTNTFVTGARGTHQHLFQIGIGIGPSLPSGTYSTNILVTASQQ